MEIGAVLDRCAHDVLAGWTTDELHDATATLERLTATIARLAPAPADDVLQTA